MRYFVCLYLVSLVSNCFSQSLERSATLMEDGTYYVFESMVNTLSSNRNTFSQLSGFPITMPAHPNFKNTRNVTLADINEDGISEILLCMNETLFVLNGNGETLWKYKVKGTSPFPPAVADIDGDGDLEIAIQTYGLPFVGNVYLFDHLGNLYPDWPFEKEYDFFVNGVSLADIDGDGNMEIFASERISSNGGLVHALNSDATSFSEDWPVLINGTPAITPSIGDINNDGMVEVITASTTQMFSFDIFGETTKGFPFISGNSKFSYQSPILIDFDGDEMYEIVGAMHGNSPKYYILNTIGEYKEGWPIDETIWTYSTPAVADIDQDGSYEVFFNRPYYSDSETGNVLRGFTSSGDILSGFPIQGFSGSEGVVAIADVDDDGKAEIICSATNTIDDKGFIHAYNIDDGTEVEGFPLRPKGFTYFNGGYLGDVNGDGMLDLTALSYQLKFDESSPDSMYVNVFNLEVPYDEESILFNGYKGANDHTGYISKELVKSEEVNQNIKQLQLVNNPVQEILIVDNAENWIDGDFSIINMTNQILIQSKMNSNTIDVTSLPSGQYILKINNQKDIGQALFIKL